MKGIINKCLLFVLSFALSSTALFTVFSANVSAASVYDNIVHNTSTLSVTSPNGQHNQSVRDDADDTWLEIILSDNQPNANARCGQTFQDSLSRAYNSDQGQYSVSQFQWSENRRLVYVTWKEEPPELEMDFVLTNQDQGIGYLRLKGQQNYAQLEMQDDGSLLWQCGVGSNSGIASNNEVLPGIYDGYLYVVKNYKFLAPDGYEGNLPPSGNPPSTEIRPVGVYRVENRSFNITSAKSLQQIIRENGVLYQLNGYLTYYVYKCTDGTYDNCSELVYSQDNLIESDQFNYVFPETGHYVVSYGYTFPGPVPKPVNPPSGEFTYPPMSYQLNIDGSSYIGQPGQEGCIDGLCPAPSPYEDCSEYGTDIIGGIGCQVRNFQVWLRVTLTGLFAPSPGFMKEYQENLTSFFNEKLGFLATSVGFIGNTFTTIINSASQTKCTVTPDGTFFGSRFTIDVCKFQEIFPAGFAVLQNIIVGITSVGLFFAALRKYHEVVDRR